MPHFGALAGYRERREHSRVITDLAKSATGDSRPFGNCEQSYTFRPVRRARRKRSDLTAYARIRNTALRLFGERGVSATSIRAVAKAAGVSPGLVQHHFPTKAALRAAVDQFVVEGVVRLLADPATGGVPVEITLGKRMVEFVRSNPDMIAYARRAMLEDDALGRKLFDNMVRLSRSLIERLAAGGFLDPGVDLAWAAIHTLLINAGPLFFEVGINRHLDHPLRSEEGLARWQEAVGDLLKRGIYSTARAMPSIQPRARSSRSKANA